MTRRTMTYCLIPVGLVALGGGVLLFAYASSLAREAANRTHCAKQLRALGQAMLMYGNENNWRPPPNLSILMVTQDFTSSVFCCPSSSDVPATGATMNEKASNLTKGGHQSYIYLVPPSDRFFPRRQAHEWILAYEPLEHHEDGANFLFDDVSVEFIPADVARIAIQQLKAGQNPPPVLSKTDASHLGRDAENHIFTR